MVLEETSTQTEGIEDDKGINHHHDQSLSSPPSTPKTFGTFNSSVQSHATDFEAGPIDDNGQNSSIDNNDDEQHEGIYIRVRSARTILNSKGRFQFLAQKFINLFSWNGQNYGQQPISTKLNTLSAVTTLVCVCLLFLYIVPLRSHATETEQESDHTNHFRSLNVKDLSFGIFSNEEAHTYTWNSIQKLYQDTKDKKRLHIQVSSPAGIVQPKHFAQSYISYKTEGNTLKIFGRPNYCFKRDSETPENVVISGATHLHLSEMDGCHYYTNIILTRWKFPKIIYIKLHKMIIREQDFHALTKFIDRHNQTLHRVEIDECMLCPSPYCDAGLINFPAHDFQITITRRRESPLWI